MNDILTLEQTAELGATIERLTVAQMRSLARLAQYEAALRELGLETAIAMKVEGAGFEALLEWDVLEGEWCLCAREVDAPESDRHRVCVQPAAVQVIAAANLEAFTVAITTTVNDLVALAPAEGT